MDDKIMKLYIENLVAYYTFQLLLCSPPCSQNIISKILSLKFHE